MSNQLKASSSGAEGSGGMSALAVPKITAIAPWFGSNRILASNVGRLLGRQTWIGVPFVGGMCELPYLDARTIVANDLHRHVINLARVVADPKLGPALYRKLRRYVLHPDALVVAQARCEMREQQMQQNYNLFAGIDREMVRNADPAPDLMWAKDYFLSAWVSRSHSAGSLDEFSSGMSIRWNANGGDSAVRFFNAIGSILAWRRALRNCSFTTLDALDFLGKCKDADGHGIYCDPPFPGPGDKYKFKVDEGFQRALALRVSSFKSCRVVMRFYRHPLIEELYPTSRWTWHEFKGRTQANTEAAELLLVNGPSFAEAA